MSEGASHRFMGAVRQVDDRPLSVMELNRRAKDLLESELGQVFVQGEVARVTFAASGHVYFALRDAESRIEAVIWARQARGIDPKALVEGAEVTARGAVTLFPPQGRYQLVIQSMVLAGKGAREAALRALIQKLSAEGLFSPERKRPLPFLPRRVGIVTSRTGAALKDILEVARRRFETMPFVLSPSRVQGEGAAVEIRLAFEALAQSGLVDVIILGRGGGSQDDLHAFNDEALARAIAASPVPVISAVGHEIDVSVTDLVADRRALTPSEAAEIAVPSLVDLQQDLHGQGERLLRGFARALGEVGQVLDGLGLRKAHALQTRLQRSERSLKRLFERLQAKDPVRKLAAETKELKALESRLVAATELWLRRAGTALATRGALLWSWPKLRPTRALRQRMQELDLRAVEASQRRVQHAKERLASLGQLLAALDPTAVLGRGYSITFHEGKPVRRGADLAASAELLTRFADGSERRSRLSDEA